MKTSTPGQTLLSEEKLPKGAWALLQKAAEVAQDLGFPLYLVGGILRDLALGQPVTDIDLVVEGDALKLAERLRAAAGGKLTAPSQFGTIKLRWEDLTVDLVTARSETYSRPGALPKVRPGSIHQDLSRRDFTINAMSIRLNGPTWGQLVDPHKGMEDLKRGLIRVLHEKSFIDDPTRIFRALRYEGRLGFRLEAQAEALLKRGLEYIKALSGERIWKELEKTLSEEEPEKPLGRAQQLGVMTALEPTLRWDDDWLKKKFQAARVACYPNPPQPILYLCLLVCALEPKAREQLSIRLKLAGPKAKALLDLTHLQASLTALAEPGISPSRIFGILSPFSNTAVLATAIAQEGSTEGNRLWLYYKDLRHVKPTLRGHHLMALGVPSGPKLGEFLQALREARMDGQAKTRADEERLVAQWLSQTQTHD